MKTERDLMSLMMQERHLKNTEILMAQKIMINKNKYYILRVI